MISPGAGMLGEYVKEAVGASLERDAFAKIGKPIMRRPKAIIRNIRGLTAFPSPSAVVS
jgi:hypothetical protein